MSSSRLAIFHQEGDWTPGNAGKGFDAWAKCSQCLLLPRVVESRDQCIQYHDRSLISFGNDTNNAFTWIKPLSVQWCHCSAPSLRANGAFPQHFKRPLASAWIVKQTAAPRDWLECPVLTSSTGSSVAETAQYFRVACVRGLGFYALSLQVRLRESILIVGNFTQFYRLRNLDHESFTIGGSSQHGTCC